MAHTWCGSSGFKHVQGASASLPKIEATPTPASTSKAKKTLAKALAVHLHCSFRNFERRDRRFLSLGLNRKSKRQ